MTYINLNDKLQNIINSECDYAQKNGSSRLSTCSHSNWDSDTWNYRNEIIKSIRNKGYNVSVSVNHGVTDIITTQKLEL